MKVYVVDSYQDGERIDGVFSTRELAEKYLNGCDVCVIEEFEVDSQSSRKYRRLHVAGVRLFSGEEYPRNPNYVDGPPTEDDYSQFQPLKCFKLSNRVYHFPCESMVCGGESTISMEAALEAAREGRRKILAAEPIEGPSGFRFMDKPGHTRMLVLLDGSSGPSAFLPGQTYPEYVDNLKNQGWTLSDPIPYSKDLHEAMIASGWGAPPEVPDLPTT